MTERTWRRLGKQRCTKQTIRVQCERAIVFICIFFEESYNFLYKTSDEMISNKVWRVSEDIKRSE